MQTAWGRPGCPQGLCPFPAFTPLPFWGRPPHDLPHLPSFPTPNILSPAPGPLPPASLLWLSGSSVVCLLRVLAGDKGSTQQGLQWETLKWSTRLVPRHGYVGRHRFPNADFCHHLLPGGGFSTWGKVRPGGIRSTEQACNAGLAISPAHPAWPQAPGHLSPPQQLIRACLIYDPGSLEQEQGLPI